MKAPGAALQTWPDQEEGGDEIRAQATHRLQGPWAIPQGKLENDWLMVGAWCCEGGLL